MSATQRITAEEPADTLSRFDVVVTKASRSLFAGRGDSQAMLPLLSQLRQEIDSGHWKEAIETVHRIRYANQGDEVTRVGGELINQIEVRAKAVETAELHALEAAADRAGEACLRANNARDLDRTVAELRSLSQRWRNDGRSESEPMFRGRARIAAALAYVQIWQDYLALRADGKEIEAARKMEELARRNEWYPVVARSEVLVRAVPPSPSPAPPQSFAVDEALKNVFAKMKSLDDLDATAAELANLAQAQSWSAKIRATSEQMARLQGARRALAGQDYAAAFQLATQRLGDYIDVAEQLAPLRQQFLLQVLPHYLPQRELVPPQPQESVASYLMRTAKSALAAKDWMLALRSFEALGTISYGQNHLPSWLRADIESLSALIEADKEKFAGEFVLAAIYYRKALEMPSENAPIEAIVARMRDLKKEHPEAFPSTPGGPSPSRLDR
ncbi:MAG: hypothetical protein DME97_04840 [Verrucomicrobia bacterium]|nr:MAG: hypothetical protein DME97_04840 [Verrucomicrobiota bacterium]